MMPLFNQVTILSVGLSSTRWISIAINTTSSSDPSQSSSPFVYCLSRRHKLLTFYPSVSPRISSTLISVAIFNMKLWCSAKMWDIKVRDQPLFLWGLVTDMVPLLTRMLLVILVWKLELWTSTFLRLCCSRYSLLSSVISPTSLPSWGSLIWG